MTELYRYQPVMIPGPTGTDYRPRAEGLTDLAELDGWRYVAVPEGVVPDVPEALTTWEVVTLTTELREAIKLASPHAQLIAQRVVDLIRAQYPMDEELYFARIAVGALQGSYTLLEGEADALAQYQADVEAAREWGRQARAELGL